MKVKGTILGTLRNGKYELIRCDDKDREGLDLYIIRGKRGAMYGLIRTYNNKRAMYVSPLTGTARTPFEGSWFKEDLENGTLTSLDDWNDSVSL